MEIDEFKKKKKKKRVSILDEFRDEILELWNENYSQHTIVEFLETKNISTTQQNISMYLSRNSKNNTPQIVVKNSNQTPKTQKKTSTKTSNQSEEKGREAVRQLGSFFGKKE